MKYSITLSSFRRIEPTDKTLSRLSSLGLDAVEMFGEPEAAEETEILRSSGVKVCGVTGMWGAVSEKSSTRRLLSADPALAKAASDYVKECVRMCDSLGGKVFNVCLFGDADTMDRTHGLPSDADKAKMAKKGVQVLSSLTEFAADHGITLALEPLNRYSTPYCCNAIDVLRILEAADRTGSLGMMLDTFHMNIEEDSFEAAITASGHLLRHTHFADNNRKMPGFGHIDFPGIIGALKKIRYDGYISFEPNIPGTDYLDDLGKGLDFIKSIDKRSF